MVLFVKTGIKNGFKTGYGVQFFAMGSRSEPEEALRAGGPEGRTPRVRIMGPKAKKYVRISPWSCCSLT